MKTPTPKVSLLLAILVLAIAPSCKKDYNGDDDDKKTPIENLNIPDGFLFNTTVDRNITVILPDIINHNQIRGRVDFLTDSPDNGGVLISSAPADANGKVEAMLRVPTYLTQVFVQTIAGTAFVDLPPLNLKEGGVVIDFNEPISLDPPNDSPEGLKTSRVSHNTNNDLPFKHLRSSVNLITNGNFSDNNFGLIPDWSSSMQVDQKWHITSTLGANHAKQHIDAGEAMLRKTSSPARYGGVAQLIAASPGDLITFTSDLRGSGHNSNVTWLFLIPRNQSGASLNFYSIQILPKQSWETKTIAATMPAGTATVQVLLWSHIYGGNIDFDNVVVTGPVTDSDGDGVDDDLDDYPFDPERAFDVFYPNKQDFGSLAYEDLWPGKGDYDFNDLVIDYQFKQVLNANYQLVEFYTDLSIRAIGASFENGFGFQLDATAPGDIANVQGAMINDNYLNIAGNGTEMGQEKAVIIAFDNAFSRIGAVDAGFVNTLPTATYIEPDTFNLYVYLNNPVSFQATGTAPFNPFLIVNKERGREVHLPGNKPTSLVNSELFGTWFDDSRPASGKYYQSATNLPWAINLPAPFDYPIEKVEITGAHLRFAEWAESGGQLYPDWYLDKAGYRNESAIYAKP